MEIEGNLLSVSKIWIKLSKESKDISTIVDSHDRQSNRTISINKLSYRENYFIIISFNVNVSSSQF